MKDFVVYTKRLANKLHSEGFKIIGTGIDNNKPWFNVYYFEDTP
jgi:hypothetical protein